MWQVWEGQTGETTGKGDCGIPSQPQPCLLLHRWLAVTNGADLSTTPASCWFIKKMEIAGSSWGTMGTLVARGGPWAAWFRGGQELLLGLLCQAARIFFVFLCSSVDDK